MSTSREPKDFPCINNTSTEEKMLDLNHVSHRYKCTHCGSIVVLTTSEIVMCKQRDCYSRELEKMSITTGVIYHVAR